MIRSPARRPVSSPTRDGGMPVLAPGRPAAARPPQRRGVALFVALALAGLSAIAFTVAAPKTATVSDYLRRSSVAGRDLRVGVFPDQPLLGEEGRSGVFDGFDVELAGAFARSLGLRPVFVSVRASERVSALVEGRVDVVFAGLLMTTERQRVIEFAGPYLVGRTVVASRTAWPPPRGGNSRLCVVSGSVAEVIMTRTRPVEARPDVGRCVTEVLAGRLDAVAGDEILLRGHAYASRGLLRVFTPAIEEPVQRYGIGVSRRDPYLKALVGSFLRASYAKGRSGAWQRAADRTLARAGYTGRQPRPEGTLLRGAGDGQAPADAMARTPPGVAATVPAPSRHGRTVAHRRRRATRRAVRLTASVARPAPGRPTSPTGDTGIGSPAPGPWSLLLAVPVAVSALYLWIQSGGDRQFTLMLAQSVNPINFLATVSLSVVWVFAAVPALILTVGSVVLSAAVDRADRQRLSAAYAVARWTARAPGWVVWASGVAATASTPLVFAPAWILALFVARQSAVTGRRGSRRWRGFGLSALAVVSAAIVVCALARDEPVLALIAGWPVALLLAGVDAPLRPASVVAFVRTSGALAAVLALGVLYAVVTTPILPSTAIQVARPQITPEPSRSPDGSVADPDASATEPPMRQLRGYVVSVDDESTTVLSDAGGVEIVANDEIRSRVSCPSFTDLPGDSAALFGLPLRESLLKSLARRQRPATLQDPRCLIRVDPTSEG
ncbi:transporter substrate-binding domain-containing protein [Micromonospora sp. KC606]|nr:transporter substrate-binding domain-containing protein [Micromonospora sp. KC606]